ncbi:MAG TPA: periplasmic heavy metal sensor [Polyangiales bacterium]
MRTQRWWWLLVPVLVGAGVFGLTRASASGPFCGWHGRHAPAASAAEVEQHLSGKLEHLLDAVDASAAQRQQAAAVAKSMSPELFQLMSQGRSLRGELKTALLAEKLDTGRIGELREQLSDLSQRLVDTGMDGVVKLSAILTPAQRAKVADKLARFHAE